MNAKQKKVSAAVATLTGKALTPLDVVRYAGKDGATIAREATPGELAAYDAGVDLGAHFADNAFAWQTALRNITTHSERVFLRRGFVSVAMPILGLTKAQADQKFSYMARLHAPASTSRKAKATAETRGRKEKAQAAVEKLSEKAVAARLVAVLAYVADAQAKHRGDDDMLEVLGAIAKLANGK